MAKAGRIVIDLTAGTAQFIVDMDAANAKLRDFGDTASGTGPRLRSVGTAADTTGRSFSSMGTHGVTGVQATSGALRVLEGNMNNNLRAAERFLATTLGLGPVLQKIFPVVGAIALIGIVDHLTEEIGKAIEAFQKLKEAPERVAQEFGKLTNRIGLSNAEMRVTNDKLDNAIAKLEGKPENGLKIALDEATVSAGKLAAALASDFEELAKLLKESNVGFFAGLFSSEATTSEFKNFLVGKQGFGGKGAQSFDVSDNLREQLGTIDESAKSGRITLEDAEYEKSAARAAARNEQERIYREVIQRANEELKKREALQAQHTKENGQTLPLNGVSFVADQEVGIGIAKKAKEFAQGEIERLELEAQNESKTKQKDVLTARAKPTDPFTNEMDKLAAELRGVQAELEAVGKSESAKVLAKSWLEAQKAIEEVNKSLKEEHKAPLTRDQETQIVTQFDTIESRKAEKEFQEAFAKTSASIAERIQLENLLTDAVGKGYEAEKAARVQGQVIQSFGGAEKFNDPEFQRTHQPQIAQRTQEVGAQDDAEHRAEIAKTMDALGNQIELETSLAAAQSQGAEAVRLVTLAYKLREITLNGASDATGHLTAATLAQIRAEIALSNAKQENVAAGKITQLDQEIDATERLTAAEIQGASAVRKAELQNRVQQIKRETPAGPQQDTEIQKVTKLSEDQHQQQITTEALKTGIAYDNQVHSIDEQITRLHEIQATQGDNLAIEISLKKLDEERTKVLSEQALVLGTAADGMKAFFHEMASDGKSAAQDVHDVFKDAFEGLNSELAKLVAGQKSSWASLFQGISSQLMKMSLQRLEANIATKFFPPAAANTPAGAQPATPPKPQGGLKGLVANLFGQAHTASPAPTAPSSGSGIGKRDGSSPSMALFVTTVDAGAAGNPDPSEAARPAVVPGTANAGTPEPSVRRPTLSAALSGNGSSEESRVSGSPARPALVPPASESSVAEFGNAYGDTSPGTVNRSPHGFATLGEIAQNEPPAIPGLKGRYSPVGVPEYTVPPALQDKYIGPSADALTQASAWPFHGPRAFLSSDSEPTLTHERIHEAQNQLKNPSVSDLSTALSPVFGGDQSKSEEYIRRTGVHDLPLGLGNISPLAKSKGIEEAPAFLFSQSPEKGPDVPEMLQGLEPASDQPHKVANREKAYGNYVDLLKSLNPGKQVGVEKVAPPEYEQNYLKTHAPGAPPVTATLGSPNGTQPSVSQFGNAYHDLNPGPGTAPLPRIDRALNEATVTSGSLAQSAGRGPLGTGLGVASTGLNILSAVRLARRQQQANRAQQQAQQQAQAQRPRPADAGALPSTTGQTVEGTGVNTGSDLTRLPSGLIQRQQPSSSGESVDSKVSYGSENDGQSESNSYQSSSSESVDSNVSYGSEDGGQYGPVPEPPDFIDLMSQYQPKSSPDANQQPASDVGFAGFGGDQSGSHVVHQSLQTPPGPTIASQVFGDIGNGVSDLSKLGGGGGSGNSSSDSQTSVNSSISYQEEAGDSLDSSYNQSTDSSSGGGSGSSSGSGAGSSGSSSSGSSSPSGIKGALAAVTGKYGSVALGVGAMVFGLLARILNKRPDRHQSFASETPFGDKTWDGFRAEGGPVTAGKLHVVGEKGPELFVPEKSGTIIPNHKLGSFKFGGYRADGGTVNPGVAYVGGERGVEAMLVSSGAIANTAGSQRQSDAAPGSTVYIDARGTDPIAVEQRVRQGMAQVYAGSVRTSFLATKEDSLRTPRMSK